MKIVVLGLWHLGSVTAACLAELGHSVIGVDESEEVVRMLQLLCEGHYLPNQDILSKW